MSCSCAPVCIVRATTLPAVILGNSEENGDCYLMEKCVNFYASLKPLVAAETVKLLYAEYGELCKCKLALTFPSRINESNLAMCWNVFSLSLALNQNEGKCRS